MSEEKTTIAVHIAIQSWIYENTNLVSIAQELSKLTISLGLVDTNTTLPFQIFPKETLDEKGMPLCDLFVNIDHAAKGFYTIKITDNEYIITSPGMYENDIIVYHDINEIKEFINNLSKELDIVYAFQDALENKKIKNANKILHQMFNEYQQNLKQHLQNIKEYIQSLNNVVIAVPGTHAYDFVKHAQKGYEQALLHPQNWYILSDVPKKGDSFEDYIDENGTNLIQNAIGNFFKKESECSSIIYLAQKVAVQSHKIIKVYSNTTNEWKEAFMNEDGFVYVVPIIDAQIIDVK